MPFRVCFRYRLLKDCPYKIVPTIHVLDSKSATVLVSIPSLPPPSSRGTYAAYCRIDPFMLNNGRYSVGLGWAVPSSRSACISTPSSRFASR